jgi:hypothetical protein
MNPNYDAPIGKTVQGKASPKLSADGVTYVWFRQGGFDSSCGTKPTMPPCPKGTAPCHSRPGYCYDPTGDMMLTTENPSGASSSASSTPPTHMALVAGSVFNYDEINNAYVSTNPNFSSVPFKNLQYWSPDKQFTASLPSNPNKIYEQFKAAAAQLMPHLKQGETKKLVVVTKGNMVSWNTQGSGSAAVAGGIGINSGWTFGKNVAISNLYDDNGTYLPKLQINFNNVDTMIMSVPKPANKNNYKILFQNTR